MIKSRLLKTVVCFAVVILIFSIFGTTEISEPKTVPASEPYVEIKRLSFIGVGDNLIHDAVYSCANRHAGGSGHATGSTGNQPFDFKPMYSGMADIIAGADVAYINQETIPGGDELGITSYPCFNSPTQLIYDMKDIGFDIFSAATNHTYDKGWRGVENAYNLYEELSSEITAPGIYKKGERNFRLHEKNDIRLGLLSYTDLTNGLSLPASAEHYVPRMDDENQIIEDLKYAKENSDFVIVFVHWGNEYQFEPSSRQRAQATLFAENGADIVIGTHPHVIQPVEYIGDVPIVYSLGNFMSAQLDKYNMVGGMISFDIVKKGNETSIEKLLFTPTVNYYTQGFRNFNVYTLDDYKISGLEKSHKLGVTADYAENLTRQVIDEEFLALSVIE